MKQANDLTAADLQSLVHALAVARLAELRRQNSLARSQHFDLSPEQRSDEILALAAVLEN